MLKLFRRIRQKLIREGALKNYVVYAIGEILLVMIGILLALQVSNWNQERIEGAKELKALVDLSKEFKLNQERIKAKQSLRISIAPKLETYIELLSSGEADYSSFEDFHSEQIVFGMTNPSNGVIDALISSGEIALISNDSLKYLLADWKNQLGNLYENEEILWNAGLVYLGDAYKTIPSPSRSWKDWSDEELESAFNDLRSKVGYRNNLIGFEGTNKIVVEECNTVLNLLDKVLSLLDDEISKHR